MTIIDLYIDLMDDRACTMVLKNFGENTSKAAIELKKIKLRKALRRQSGLTTKKNTPDPFAYIVGKQRMDLFEGLSEKEFFYFISEAKTERIADYIKLANAYYYYPDALESRLPEYIKNMEDGKYIFSTDYPFSSKDELISYLNKTMYYKYNDKDGMLRAIDTIIEHLPPDDFELYRKLKDETKNFSLINLHELLNTVEETSKPYLYQLAYAHNHPDEDKELLYSITIEAMDKLLNLQQDNYMDNLDAKIELNSLKSKWEEIKKKSEDMARQNKELEKQNKELTKQVENYKAANSNSSNNLAAVKAEHEKLILTLNEKHNEELKVERLRLAALENKLKDLEKHFEISGVIESYDIAVIHCFDNVDILKMIYPDVHYIHAWDFHKSIDKLKGVRTLYIQRLGIDTPTIQKIKQIAKDLNIKSEVISVNTQKDIIETICLNKKSCGGK